MVLTRPIALCALLLIVLCVGPGAPSAFAHPKHDEEAAARNISNAAAMNGASPAMREAMADHRAAMEEEAPPAWPGRILAWSGRMHPFAVHFPIALIPISWLALIIARRRGDTIDLIRAFVIFAGTAAVGAAALGWLNAGFALAEDNPIQSVHRWIGTALGLIGALIALWAWRKASSVNSRTMVWTLGIVTFTLLVQGWFGGAITHGVRHMMI